MAASGPSRDVGDRQLTGNEISAANTDSLSLPDNLRLPKGDYLLSVYYAPILFMESQSITQGLIHERYGRWRCLRPHKL